MCTGNKVGKYDDYTLICLTDRRRDDKVKLLRDNKIYSTISLTSVKMIGINCFLTQGGVLYYFTNDKIRILDIDVIMVNQVIPIYEYEGQPEDEVIHANYIKRF